MVLNSSEYDAAYFGDQLQPLRHDAGYSNYNKLFQLRSWNEVELKAENPLYENVKRIITTYNLQQGNNKILEIGGANGQYAKLAQDLGLKWTSLDVSQWCNDNLVSDPAQHILADALTELQSMRKNQYDHIISFRVMECFEGQYITDLITEMNRVSKNKQIHVIDESSNPLYYTNQLLSWWATQGFEVGTILLRSMFDTNEVVV